MNTISKKHILSGCLLNAIFMLSVSTNNIAYANEVDEAAEACVEAARLIQEDDDLDAAIEEATWCLTGLRQLKEEIKLSLLPDELAGFTGGEIKNESIMGITTINRDYTRDGKKLTVSMVSTGGAAGALGGLGELGKLIGAFESAGASGGGGKKIRIQRRTVIVNNDGGKGSLNIKLKSGGNLNVESRDLNADALVEFMREFPIAKLDDAMSN